MKLGKWTLLVSCLCVASAVNAQVGKKVVQAVVSNAAKEGTVVMAETVGKTVAPAVMGGVVPGVFEDVMGGTRSVVTGPIVSTPAPTPVVPSIYNTPSYSSAVSSISRGPLKREIASKMAKAKPSYISLAKFVETTFKNIPLLNYGHRPSGLTWKTEWKEDFIKHSLKPELAPEGNGYYTGYRELLENIESFFDEVGFNLKQQRWNYEKSLFTPQEALELAQSAELKQAAVNDFINSVLRPDHQITVFTRAAEDLGKLATALKALAGEPTASGKYVKLEDPSLLKYVAQDKALTLHKFSIGIHGLPLLTYVRNPSDSFWQTPREDIFAVSAVKPEFADKSKELYNRYVELKERLYTVLSDDTFFVHDQIEGQSERIFPSAEFVKGKMPKEMSKKEFLTSFLKERIEKVTTLQTEAMELQQYLSDDMFSLSMTTNNLGSLKDYYEQILNNLSSKNY